jgi:hypothetical protein
MGIVSVVHAERRLLVATLIGMLGFTGGCGDAADVGESTATPAMPPPGRSAADRKKALEQEYGTKDQPKSAAPEQPTGPGRGPVDTAPPKQSE